MKLQTMFDEKWLSDALEREAERQLRVMDYYGWYTFKQFKIKKVIYNDPATIVLWNDGTKTVVKCMEGDTFSQEMGLAMCICKKALGENFHKTFHQWVDYG